MMEKFKLLAGVGPVLFGALLCPRAVAQLRSDLIESTSSEKEANLTPERAPKAERKIVWAEKWKELALDWNHSARLRLRHRTAV